MFVWYRGHSTYLLQLLCLCWVSWICTQGDLDGDSWAVARLRLVLGTPHPVQVGIAKSSVMRLQTLLQEPVAVSDLMGMGDRIQALSSLVQATMAEPLLDRWPLLQLLHGAFPWARWDQLAYVPWAGAAPRGAGNTGIVVCTGDRNFLYAAHLIATLRNVLHSTLPIQIAYSGDGDLSPAHREALVSLGAGIDTLDLLDFFQDERVNLRQAGWGQKPFALLASRFQRAILVDADTIFLQKPDDMFDTVPGLVETGTMFWHDRAMECSFKPIRDWFQGVLGGREASATLQQSSMWQKNVWHQMESGVVFLDKGRAKGFMSLVFAVWMNTADVRDLETYDHTWGECRAAVATSADRSGDKETYWIAAEITETAYYFVPEHGGSIGRLDEDNSTMCGTHMAHTDADKRLMWFNGSVRENKYFTGRELARFTHWMAGGADYPAGPRWSCVSDGMTWCLSGDDAVVIRGSEHETLLRDIMGQAAMMDQILFEV